jgi:hypothetical protein
MNPVTRGLLKQLNDPDLDAFVESWDALEVLVVEIYKQKSLSFAQQEDFFRLQEALAPRYAALEADLHRYWPATKIKGQPVTADPFRAVIGKASAKEFVENWDAMKTLPAAREALNQLLMAKIELVNNE